MLLQVLDDGRLTDGEGRTVDFANTVIVMTSNLGAGRARRALGFTGGSDDASDADETRMLAAAKDAFLPEFLNRIDETVTFRALEKELTRVIIGGRIAPGATVRAESRRATASTWSSPSPERRGPSNVGRRIPPADVNRAGSR